GSCCHFCFPSSLPSMAIGIKSRAAKPAVYSPHSPFRPRSLSRFSPVSSNQNTVSIPTVLPYYSSRQLQSEKGRGASCGGIPKLIKFSGYLLLATGDLPCLFGNGVFNNGLHLSG